MRCSPRRCSHRIPPPPPWSPRQSAGPCGSSAPAAALAGWPRSSATTPTRPPAGCAGCASSPSRPQAGVLTSVRVLVAGDHEAVRDGLRLMLGVVLMDLHLPDCDGVQVTRLIARQPPHVRVVVLTGFSDDDPVFAALRAGARGLLTTDVDEVLQAMPAVRAGGAQPDPSVQRRLAGAMVRGERPGVPGARQADAAPDGLTQREVEVLTEIAAGLSNAEIAA